MHHAVNVLVKMDPAETLQHPELLLTFDTELTDLFEEEINQLTRG